MGSCLSTSSDSMAWTWSWRDCLLKQWRLGLRLSPVGWHRRDSYVSPNYEGSRNVDLSIIVYLSSGGSGLPACPTLLLPLLSICLTIRIYHEINYRYTQYECRWWCYETREHTDWPHYPENLCFLSPMYDLWLMSHYVHTLSSPPQCLNLSV